MVKSVLVALGRRVPYSHNIVELLEILGHLQAGDDVAAAAAALNELGVAPRYPRAPGLGTRVAVLPAREQAVALRAWALAALEQPAR